MTTWTVQKPLFRIGSHTVKCSLTPLLGGLALIGLGLLMPLLLTERNLMIYDHIHQALLQQDSGILINAALRLVLMNTLRSLPFYLGIMLVMESIIVEPERVAYSVVRYVLSFVLLLGIYELIERFYGIRYTVEIPAIFVLLIVRLLNMFPCKLSSKVIIILLFFMSVQGLDITPGLTEWGFGRGEISLDIKRVAMVLDCESFLIGVSVMLFLVFAVCTVLMALLTYEQRQRTHAMEANQRMQQQLFNSREEALQARSFREMQSLVHDLKAPLTTIEGLSSLTLMMTQDSKAGEYQRKICDSVELMSDMISEMLYADRRTPVLTARFEETILSHFSPNENIERLRTENTCSDQPLLLNITRMTRAVINLLENASHAIDPQTGSILLRLDCANGRLMITVHDNGRGISGVDLQRIWEPGFSGDTSTGLGLSFVRQVAQEHGGDVHIESRKDMFTSAVITVPTGEGKTQ